MITIHPHINFNGNAEEAFLFYQSIFGGTPTNIIRFIDIASEHFTPNKEEEQKLMNIALPIGEHTMLIGNDVPKFMGTVNESENRSKISVQTDSKEQAIHIFEGLSMGGTVELPFTQNTENTYFGMLRDTFGIEWIVNCTTNQ